MSWRTSTAGILLRRAGRRLGVNRVVAQFFVKRGYEESFQRAMIDAIRPGDIVWDVGANVGRYAAVFSQTSGSCGRVFAYEPSPINRGRLFDHVRDLDNVVVVPVALGEREDTVFIEQGIDAFGATTRVRSTCTTSAPETVQVRQTTGDNLIAARTVAAPAVIKIDTEGCELEVLRGLRRTLQSRELRTVGVEVHFGLLAERGTPHAPSEIEHLLTNSGFSVRWSDPSHLVATRLV